MRHRASSGEREWSAAERAATAMAWFSIGLGAVELCAPRAVAKLAGIRKPRRVEGAVRALGARELATGAAILSNPRQATWLWSRVAGNAMDLWMLQRARQTRGAHDHRFFAATAAVAAVTATDIVLATLAQRLTSRGHRDQATASRLLVARAVTVNRSVDEVYRFWRDLTNLPRIMRGIESIAITSPRQSHWRVRVPGAIVEWDAEIVDELENELIAWRAEGPAISHTGSVSFKRAPGARGTEIVARFEYAPRGGVPGSSVAWLFDGLFERQVQDDLRRCKQFLETGEIPLSDGPGLRRPAQPSADPAEIRSLAGMY